MDDFQVAKLEFEAVVNNALEDSPSRQLARQKLQKVRALRGTATASPLYHAVLEDMLGGMGTGKKSARHGAPRGHVLLHGRRVPKAELQDASLYKLARLWLLDNPAPEEQHDSSIDVFSLPPLPPRERAKLEPEGADAAGKRSSVEQLLRGAAGPAEAPEQLRAQAVQRAKRLRAAHVAELEAQEKQSARLLHLEARLNVSLRGK